MLGEAGKRVMREKSVLNGGNFAVREVGRGLLVEKLPETATLFRPRRRLETERDVRGDWRSGDWLERYFGEFRGGGWWYGVKWRVRRCGCVVVKSEDV